MNSKVYLYILCLSVSLIANLVPQQKLIRFIKKQRKTSQRYKDKPLAIISGASKLLGYGSITKDDLYLLDRMPKMEYELKKLIDLYPVNTTISYDRVHRWRIKHFKRSDVIKELRQFTAEQCGCHVNQAYAHMRDRTKIDNDSYFSIVIQNLHDLYLFIKTIE